MDIGGHKDVRCLGEGALFYEAWIVFGNSQNHRNRIFFHSQALHTIEHFAFFIVSLKLVFRKWAPAGKQEVVAQAVCYT